MPVTINTGKLKIKNNNDGYIEMDAIANNSIADMQEAVSDCITEVNNAAAAAVDSIPETWTELSDEVDELKSEVYIHRDSIFESENQSWVNTSTTYHYGWRNGYYSGDVGETLAKSSSNNYIRALQPVGTENYSDIDDAAAIMITPPTGYGVVVRETDQADKVIAIYRDIGGSLIRYDKTHRYYVSMDGFNNDGSTKADDETFCASIVLSAMFSRVDALEDRTSENESAINVVNAKTGVFEDVLISDESISWANYGTAVSPLGWRTGYYSASNQGQYSSSDRYICSDAHLLFSPGVAKMECEAPEGYAISATELDENGAYVTTHGNMNSTDSAATHKISVTTKNGYMYRFSVGRFADSASSHITSEFISDIKITTTGSTGKAETYRHRTGEFEFFTVDVLRPLSFGGQDTNTETQTIECVLRLPVSYSTMGKPTRLVLACHGAAGYIQASTNTWYNSSWKEFMDFLLDNGYAVFDANVLPASSDLKGRANGSPLYVNVLKNAYDYIQANYNVYREIFAHGTSMGGLGASAFANAYPGIVLAESSFAGRDIIQYITRLKAGTYDDSLELAVPWGYNDTAALKSDKWSHIVGAAPSMSLVKYTNGVAAFAPDRELNFSDWLTWYADVYSYGRNSEPTWKGCAKRIIPYKAWDSWADKETGESESTLMRAKLILRDAFTRGSSVPYEVVVYEDYTHTDLSYGKVVHDESDDISMRYELVAWFKRWE